MRVGSTATRMTVRRMGAAGDPGRIGAGADDGGLADRAGGNSASGNSASGVSGDRAFAGGAPAENVLIELAGEFDTEGRLRFREQIGELLGRGGGVVTVDVGGLRSVDIAGLAALLRADLLLRRVHTELRIRSATPAFLQLVRDTGLTGRLRIEEQPVSRG